MLNPSRRSVLQAAAALAALGWTARASAAIGVPFDAPTFEAARRSGSPLLVAIHADWCTTCRAQEKVITDLLRERRFAGLKVFRVDFDAQTDVVRRLGARDRSTLIVFKGGKEVARVVGEMRSDAIADLLGRAM